jgi:hypothetical protein
MRKLFYIGFKTQTVELSNVGYKLLSTGLSDQRHLFKGSGAQGTLSWEGRMTKKEPNHSQETKKYKETQKFHNQLQQQNSHWWIQLLTSQQSTTGNSNKPPYRFKIQRTNLHQPKPHNNTNLTLFSQVLTKIRTDSQISHKILTHVHPNLSTRVNGTTQCSKISHKILTHVHPNLSTRVNGTTQCSQISHKILTRVHPNLSTRVNGTTQCSQISHKILTRVHPNLSTRVNSTTLAHNQRTEVHRNLFS